MTCEQCRQALSARLDGEEPGLPPPAVDRHLAECADCTRFLQAGARLDGELQARRAEPVPDLTPAILASVGALERAGRRSHGQRDARVGLACVGAVQLVLALATVLSTEAAVGLHASRELGSFAVGLGVGFLLAAWRPERASGLLPVVAALAACLTATALVDVLSARTTAAGESVHAVELLGLAFVWVLTRSTSGGGARRTATVARP